MLMVVVLEQLSQQQKVKWKGIARIVTVVVVFIAVLVATPVDRSAVNRSHQEMQRQEEVHPPGRGEDHVKNDVASGPGQA